jgi:hypothetical protein
MLEEQQPFHDPRGPPLHLGETGPVERQVRPGDGEAAKLARLRYVQA